MKKLNQFPVLAILLTLFCVSCNNFFHDLIPPDGNRIISFELPDQIEKAGIGDHEITATLDPQASLHDIVPRIGVSPKASVIPLTLDYIRAAFPGIDVVKEAAALYETSDLKTYVTDLIKDTPDFSVPALDTPIDFSAPVDFLVVSGQGNVRQYTAYVSGDSGSPKLLGFSFSKYHNPELVYDRLSVTNEDGKTVQAAAVYPAEMTLSYRLIPSFAILGDSLEVDGVSLRSGEDAIQFSSALNIPQTKTITVKRDGKRASYTLTVLFTEDPDTVRSITDFRFVKTDNPMISATSVASISKSDNLGNIRLQVFYSGYRPTSLVPRFITPGTASVRGIEQTSGSTIQNFSSPLEYLVVSRNGQYRRTYTVEVDFVNVSDAAPVITRFGFSKNVNPELSQDSEGTVSDAAGKILLDARYSGTEAPRTLIPDFSAAGIVTVLGSVQTSGMSAQNFSRQVKYTVTHPENPLLKRDYWVETSFIRDASSDAVIRAFSFHPAENPGLGDEITGRVDQVRGEISLYAPIGSWVTIRKMRPRFEAEGSVSVAGEPQVSGVSGGMFNAPVVYTVVSANGLNQKEYTVKVRELSPVIYVNQAASAAGYNDGTSWENAFVSLKAACEAAALFPGEVPKEIWIAKGTYQAGTTSADYFPITPNTAYIGGFAGGESAKSQRNPGANRVTITGNVSSAVVSGGAAFKPAPGNPPLGETRFEDICFDNFPDYYYPVYINSSISIDPGAAGTLTVQGCRFTNISGYGIQSVNNSVSLKDSHFEQVGRVAEIFSNNSVSISGIVLQSCKGGIHITDGNGATVNINGVYARDNDVSGTGKGLIWIDGVFSEASLSGLDIESPRIGFGSSVISIQGNGGVLLDNISVRGTRNTGRAAGKSNQIIHITNNGYGTGGRVEITNTLIEDTDLTGDGPETGALVISRPGADVLLDHVTVEDVRLLYNLDHNYRYACGISVLNHKTLSVKDVQITGIETPGETYAETLRGYALRIVSSGDETTDIERLFISYIIDNSNSQLLWTDLQGNLSVRDSGFECQLTPYYHTLFDDLPPSLCMFRARGSILLEGLNLKSIGGLSWLHIQYHQNLSVRDMDVENSFLQIYSNTDESTVLDNVVMHTIFPMTGYYNEAQLFGLQSGISVKNSRLILQTAFSNPSIPSGALLNMALGRNNQSAYAIFENCVFDCRGISQTYTTVANPPYVISAPANVHLQVKNSTFLFNNADGYQSGAIQAKGGFDLENIWITGFKGSRPLLSIDGGFTYRVKIGSSSYNGLPLSNPSYLYAFQSLVELTGGAVLSPEF